MKDLRDRCEKLYQRMNAACVTRELKEFDLDLLESFAREIRNEALEEAARACDDNGYAFAEKAVRALLADALAIMASPEKGSSD